MRELNKEEVIEALRKVIEPDLKKDIVSLELVSYRFFMLNIKH